METAIRASVAVMITAAIALIMTLVATGPFSALGEVYVWRW
jgi:hypothetical protein